MVSSDFLKLGILIITLLVLNSCSVAYRTLLGVDSTLKWKSSEQVIKDSEKRKISATSCFILDTASYQEAVITVFKNRVIDLKKDTLNIDSTALHQAKSNAKNDLQPVQIRYFTKTGEPIFKMINCYVEPLFPMNWNVDSCFDSFPPKTIEYLTTDTNENLSFFLPHLKTLNNRKVQLSDLPESDYYALVFWNDYMIRPSKTLIKQLKEYQLNYPSQNTFFLYVNNHNALIWGFADSELRAEIKQELEKEAQH